MSYKAQLALQEIESDMNKRIGYYEHGMLDRETERLQLLKDAETAIGNKEFEVWFQPKRWYGGGTTRAASFRPRNLFRCLKKAIISAK